MMEQVDVDDGPVAISADQLRQKVKNLRYNKRSQRLLYSPTQNQLLGRFSVFCLIMNRTIASGIFKQPANILIDVGSTAGTLIITIAAGFITLCIVACWIELGLTVPSHYIFYDNIWQKVSTPRSGGDKNYLEYIYKVPRFLMTCIFGVTFIIFGNLTGNAIQFGIYMTSAIHPDCTTSECYDSHRRDILLWAVGILTICALINVSSRSYLIRLNNIFGVSKFIFLIAISLMGIIWGSAHGDGCRQINFSAPSRRGQFGDIVQALFYAIYPYTGYEQPFYVLAEVADPQRTFAKATMYTMASTVVLFPLVNVGYFCTIPYTGNNDVPDNMGTALFKKIVNSQDGTPGSVGVEQALNVILAVFVFGNLLAQTYTATRVKQEIAKEGILPWSLGFSTGSTTWLARLRSRNKADDDGFPSMAAMDSHPEEAPIAATALHLAFEIALVVGFGVPLHIQTAYNFLTYIYTYAVVVLLGLFTAGGLLYLKANAGTSGDKGRKWRQKSSWQPWFDPMPAVVATATTAFLVGASFAPTSGRAVDDLPWWAEPLAGLACVFLGVLWWLGLRLLEWKRHERLHVIRQPHIVLGPDGEGVQKAEFIEHRWEPK